MPYRRMAAAAALLLAVIYGKLLMSEFREEALPAMDRLLGTEQIVLILPESVAAWLTLD